jgi:hypothetical protein
MAVPDPCPAIEAVCVSIVQVGILVADGVLDAKTWENELTPQAQRNAA